MNLPIEAAREAKTTRDGSRHSTLTQNSTIRNPFEANLQRVRDLHGNLQYALEILSAEKIPPLLLGKGGEHLVFEIPQKLLPEHMRGVVVKVNYHYALKYLRARVFEDAHKQDQVDRAMRQEIQRHILAVAKLRSCVGREAVPAERAMIREVPVSAEIVRLLGDSTLAEAQLPSTIPAPVVVQRRLNLSPQEEGERWVDCTGHYPEQALSALRVSEDAKQRRREAYDAAHELLVGKDADVDFAESLKHIHTLYPDLDGVADLVKQEIELPEQERLFTQALRQFVLNLLRYTRETKSVLDFAGSKNVVFLREDDAWKPKLVDAVPFFLMTFLDLENITRRLQNQERRGLEVQLQPIEAKYATNPLNTLRILNALAILAGVEERLDVQGLKEIPASVWREGLVASFSQKEKKRIEDSTTRKRA